MYQALAGAALSAGTKRRFKVNRVCTVMQVMHTDIHTTMRTAIPPCAQPYDTTLCITIQNTMHTAIHYSCLISCVAQVVSPSVLEETYYDENNLSTFFQ